MVCNAQWQPGEKCRSQESFRAAAHAASGAPDASTQAKRDRVGKLGEPGHNDRLQDMLVCKSESAERLDVGFADFRRFAV